MNLRSDSDQLRNTIRRRTIIAFLCLGLFLAGCVWGWKRLYHSTRKPDDKYIQPALRKGLDANARLFEGTFSGNRLAKTYPLSDAVKNVRVNGKLGMDPAFDTASWKLHVVRAEGDTLMLTMADIKKLPRTDIIFDFKCIEGWNQITHWGGVKMEDFIKAYQLEPQTAKRYMGLQTPDKGYYIGLDMPSAIHTQTMLCYEMNGQPLPVNQGAPLRLIIPVKYGIKHLKRIGIMFFSDTPPRDYWAEQGYDYYAGH